MTHMKADELQIGDYVEASSPCFKEKMIGHVTCLCQRPVNGITLKLDSGGELFIAKNGSHTWNFERVKKEGAPW